MGADDPTSTDFVELNHVPAGIAAKVQSKRELEQARKQRVLNAKVRTIGIDKDALDAQVAARSAVLVAEKQATRKLDEEQIEVDTTLKLLELERQRMHKTWTRDVVDFNATHMQKQYRKEYDLSDPHALKKDQPTRVGDEDPRLGPSSIQVFAGEDLKKGERVKAQQAQQRNWLEQQVYEKKVIAGEEMKADADFSNNVMAMVTLRSELEKEESNLRKELTKIQLDYNDEKRLAKMEQMKETRFDRPAEEKIADYREMVHHSQDEFLNETKAQYNVNGRIRRDEFRGLSKDEWLACDKEVKMQTEYKSATAKALQKEDREIDAMAEQARKVLVAVEQQKMTNYTSIVKEELMKNEDLKKSTKTKDDFSMDPDEYFKHYGQSQR